MKHVLTFESFLNEANINSQSFPNFESYLENLIPKNKRISFFIEDHRLLIGYFPESASMADLSKSLPERVKDELDEKFAGSRFTFMDELVKPDPMSGKKMIFSAVSAKTQKDLLQIEDLFKSELNESSPSRTHGGKIPKFKPKAFDQVKAGDVAHVFGDLYQEYTVVATGLGKDFVKKLKQYDESGIVTDMQMNPANYGLEAADWEELELIAVATDSPRDPSSVYTYGDDGAWVNK